MCSFLTPSEKSSPWGRLSSIIWSIKHPKPQTSAAKPYSPGQQTVDGLSIFQNGLAGGLELSGVKIEGIIFRLFNGRSCEPLRYGAQNDFSEALCCATSGAMKCGVWTSHMLWNYTEFTFKHGNLTNVWQTWSSAKFLGLIQVSARGCKPISVSKRPTWSELLVFSGCDSQQLNFKIIQDTLKKGLKRYKQIILVVSIETSPNPR